MNFDFPYVLEVIPAIMKYVPLTLFMSILAMAVAILIGILLAVMKESKKSGVARFHEHLLVFLPISSDTGAAVHHLLWPAAIVPIVDCNGGSNGCYHWLGYQTSRIFGGNIPRGHHFRQ